jgi:hypothetical protein
MATFDLYVNIAKRMIAVFIAQALSVIGAGSLVGIDVLQSSLLAGLLGVANVVEVLARKYLNDGQLTLEEINQAFGVLDNKSEY